MIFALRKTAVAAVVFLSRHARHTGPPTETKTAYGRPYAAGKSQARNTLY